MEMLRELAARAGRGRRAGQVLALGAVATGSSLFAHYFRASGKAALELISGWADPVTAARHLPAPVVFLWVGLAVVVSAAIGHGVTHHLRRGGLTGLAAAAHGDRCDEPSMPLTLARAVGTWVSSASLVSVGRESAILETGGALGTALERRVRLAPGTLTAVGLAAAFASAYQAPIAAVVYLVEHVGLRRERSAVAAVVAAAAIGAVITFGLFGEESIFPHHRGGLAAMALLGLVAVVPTTLGARLFLRIRDRAAVAAVARLPVAARALALAALGATVVAVAGVNAGNGMEALRHASTEQTLAIALALALGKLVATSAALAAGVPGGVFSPTISNAAGWALLTYVALGALGAPLPADLWDGLLVAMVVGVAAGIRAPFTAAFVVPEMAGDYRILPVTVAVAAVVAALDHLLDQRLPGAEVAELDSVHDEDS